MKGAPSWMLTFLLAIAAVLFLRALAPDDQAEPTVSAENPGPRGLLVWTTWLRAQGASVVVHRGALNTDTLQSSQTIVVPPPEAMPWARGDVEVVRDAVRAGAVLVVLCDDDARRVRRLGGLLSAFGVECAESGLAVQKRVSSAVGDGTLDFPAIARRLVLATDSGFVPLHIGDAGGIASAIGTFGQGHVVVLADGSVLQNDGLERPGNAAFWSALPRSAAPATAQQPEVVVVQTHHTIPYAAAVDEAFGRWGPRTGFFCFALLLLASLLGLWPRRGDRLVDVVIEDRPAAADVYALAALYRRVANKAKRRGGAENAKGD